MKYDLHERIAACLGWTVGEVQSFSLATISEMVRTKDPALYDEICLVREQGLHLTEPVRDPRRVPMPDMSWLGPPPPKTRCEFCGEENVRLVAVLVTDPDQRVCKKCHDDRRIPTKPIKVKP